MLVLKIQSTPNRSMYSGTFQPVGTGSRKAHPKSENRLLKIVSIDIVDFWLERICY